MNEINKNNFLAHNYFILNSMDDWVRIIDPEGEVIFVNDKMRQDTEHVKFLASLVNNYEPMAADQDSQVMKTTTIVEEKLIDGKYYSIKTSPVYYEGVYQGLIEVYRDITSESKMKIDLFNANRQMLDDIRFVRKIQNSILPKNKSYGQIELEGRYIPSNDLSGDLFDIIKIADEKYAFYIADVMGHGVKSSMMTMFVKLTLSSIFERHPQYGPEKSLLKIREKFVDLNINTSQYFTMWLGIFDLKNNKLKFSNAGHNCPPLFFRKKTNKIEELEIGGRMISNLIEVSQYKEVEIDFCKEDEILFYTDGATESQNHDKSDYSVARLKEKFSQTSDLDEILEDITDYTWGEQKDDIALAVIKYKENL